MHPRVQLGFWFCSALLMASVCLIAPSGLAQVKEGSDSAPTISPDQAVQHLVTKVQPEYPPLAKAAGIQGIVRLSIVIDKDGKVKDLKLVSGHPMLAPAAFEAIRKWKYQPFLVDGKSSTVRTEVQVSIPQSVTQADIDKARKFEEAYWENRNWGQAALNKGDFTTAEAKFSMARKAADEAGEYRWQEQAGILNLLGRLKQDSNDFSGAEQCYKQALDVRLKNQGPDNVDVAGAQEDLAILYYSNRQFEKAEPFVLQSLKIYEAQMRDASPKDQAGIGRNLAIEYAALSQIALARGDEQESKNHCRRALDYAEKWSKPSEKDTIASRCLAPSASK